MRAVVAATVTDGSGEVVGYLVKQSWNAAIRGGEAIVRAIARSAGTIYEGDVPEFDRTGPVAVVGDVYTRRWRAMDGAGEILMRVERSA